MKKLVKVIVIGAFAYILAACAHSAKENDSLTHQNAEEIQATNDDIVKDVFIDSYGDRMEITKNNTRNTVIIHLDGKTYELTKNNDLPEFSASDHTYLYTDHKGDITFTKKDIGMVLFHHKKSQNLSKMAVSP